MEHELEATRKSLSFIIGHLIREAVASPLREIPLLPFRLRRLLKDRRDRVSYGVDGNANGSPIHGKDLRNRLRYHRPEREENAFIRFEACRSTSQSSQSTLRIACILGERLTMGLEAEADLTHLQREHWQEMLRKDRPDFLLVQSSVGNSDHRRSRFSDSSKGAADIEALTSFCRKEGIPTVFWDTENHIHYPLFVPMAKLFDRVFAADPESVKAYAKLMATDAGYLAPAIQPVRHNPLRPLTEGDTGFTVLFDGWADLLEYPSHFEFLKPLFPEGLHIVESRYRFMANKLDDLPAFKTHIMGSLSYARLLTAMRHYRVLLMAQKSLSSPLARTWQAMEAIACGASVVVSGNLVGDILDGMVTSADDDRSLGEKALMLLSEEVDRLRKVHLARRRLYSAHTYAHRLTTICESLDIDYDWEPFPRVTVILPTKRPERIQECLQTFSDQTYPNKELIIIVNADNVVPADMRQLAAEHTDVKVLRLHQEKNIGTCLNVGIANASGKYWCKMDDDDLYGANYLLDMIHLLRSADVDVIGKPPGFIYLDEHDQVYLRDGAIASQYKVGNGGGIRLCGATIGGKIETFAAFSENHRACVDTLFVENIGSTARTVVSGDVWNFIACRSKAKDDHTWRYDDADIIAKATACGVGLNIDGIMI